MFRALSKTFKDRAHLKVPSQKSQVKKDGVPPSGIHQYLPDFWLRWQYPSCHVIMKADKVDENVWRMIYRSEYSRTAIWSMSYVTIITLAGGIGFIYFKRDQLFEYFREKAEDTDDSRENFFFTRRLNQIESRGALYCAILLIIGSSISLIPLLRTPHRGYYSPSLEKFLFIKPNLLMPWKPQKIYFEPGDVFENHGNQKLAKFTWTLQKDKKKYLMPEQYFFLTAYRDVLCGYLPPKILKQTQIDPDLSFKMIISGN